MITFLNTIMGLSALALCASLALAMTLSSPFRHAFARRLPEQIAGPLSGLFSSLWLVVVLIGGIGATRLLYATQGSNTFTATAATSVITTLSIVSCWYVSAACWRLHKGGL